MSICCPFFPYWYERSPLHLTTALPVFLWTELQWTWACQSGCCWNTSGKEIGANLSCFTLGTGNVNHQFFQGHFLFLTFLLLQMTEHLGCADNGVFVLAANQNMWKGWKLRGGFGWNRFFQGFFFFLSKTKIGRYCAISEENTPFEHKKILCFGGFVTKILKIESSL